MSRRAFNASLAIGVTGLLLSLKSAPAQAADDGHEIPDQAPSYVTDVLGPSHLYGAGVFKYFGFHIYDAYLWVGAAGFSPDHAYDQPFALDIKYARKFKGSAINQTTIDEWDRLELGTEQQRHDWYTRLAPMMPDVVPDQHLTGFFSPTDGWKLESDGTQVGVIPDVEFAKAFFAIWLDPRTKAPALRRGLLSLPAT
jgi:hypothetical protein